MTKIDGILLKQMIISGANNLYNNYPEVDALNVSQYLMVIQALT